MFPMPAISSFETTRKVQPAYPKCFCKMRVSLRAMMQVLRCVLQKVNIITQRQTISVF